MALPMTRVSGVAGGAPVSTGSAKAKAAPGGGFDVSDLSDGVAGARIGAMPAVPSAGLAGMLALQEAEAETVGNRNARRHGLAVLEALRALQYSLLGASSDAGQEVAALLRLADTTNAVADAALADVLAAIRLRAKIELLRRGVETA
jgi:hypothetical protein